MKKNRKIRKTLNKIIYLLRGNPLTAVSLAGLVLTLILAWTFLFYSITRNRSIYPEQTASNFTVNLTKYDSALVSENAAQLEKRLENLEKQAKTQDDWLSILKRRRILAGRDQNQRAAYIKSAAEAAGIFPYSEVMAAVAGESLLANPVTDETAKLLQEYAGRISQPRFYSLALGFNVLAGTLENPQAAEQAIKQNPAVQSFMGTELPPGLAESISADNLLLGILNNDPDSAIRISEAIRANPGSAEYLSLGGQYFYDHGNPQRAAQLFAGLGENYAEQTAAALAKAG
ncbi:MAG: hypothetical protein FWF22_08390, partial [Treponema sp.]|nr:hypothetical protein [Treponema sp.]